MRRLLLTSGLVLAITVAAPAGAGQTERIKTKVTIRDACLGKGGGPGFQCRPAARARRQYVARFSGRVKSDEPRCERRRKVKVILVEPVKPRMRGGREVIGTTRSNADGRWRFEDVKPGFGYYIAKATTKRKGDIVCKADKSPRTRHVPVV